MLPFPNLIVGIILGIFNSSWSVLFLLSIGWGFVFLGIKAITSQSEKVAFITHGQQGKKLGFSKGVWFYIIEFWTGFATSLFFGTIVYFIAKIFR